MSQSLKRIPLKVSGLSVDREVLLAEPHGANQFIVQSIPAFIYGLAYGDEIEVENLDTGEFQIVKRGGHVTLRVFLNGPLDRVEIDELIERVTEAGGLHEIGKNAKADADPSLLLLSVPVSIGFLQIEEAMHTVQSVGAKWEFGNVYSEDGAPLNWW